MADEELCTAYFGDQLWSFGENVYGVCSGHGVCVDGRCVCDEGWTGLSDWVNADGFDCHINITAYKITWAIMLVFQTVMIVLSVPYLFARYESYKQIRDAKHGRGESYYLWNNRGAFAMVLYYAIGAPTIMGMSILKMAKDDERIGVTPGVTVCYAIYRVVFYTCYVLFTPALLETVVKGAKGNTNDVIRWNYRLSYLFLGFHCLAAMLPFISIANPELQQEVNMMQLGVMILTGIWMSSQAWYVTHTVNKTLDASYEVSRLEKTLVMKNKLAEVKRVPFVVGPIYAIIYSVVLIWPFLWTKQDYILAISWLVYPITGLRVAKTSLTARENSRLDSSAGQSTGPASFSNSASEGPKGLGSEQVTTFQAHKDNLGSVQDSTGEDTV